MLIKSPADFINWLTDFVAGSFTSPRLKNPKARIAERAAAERLCTAGYRASHVKSIWLFSQKHHYFSTRINSVQALAEAILDPPNPNWLEADYDVWVKAHPPMCAHGYLIENKKSCPGCNADPDCITCHGTGETVERVAERKDKQFICDCSASKMGLPSLQEQVAHAAERYWSKRKKPVEPEDGEVL